MEMPHEIIVWYLLPALRKELVVALKDTGLSQKDVAKKMNITEAAISQYLHNKRGSKDIRFSATMGKEIKKSAVRVRDAKNSKVVMKELVRLVTLSTKEKIVCKKCGMKDGKCEICNIHY